ncbi:nucleoside-specific channel-forming protein [Citrobacter koseri]|uniref:Nucleoside-specific channel-forming protein Tsx n=1 Tax=Citrobacter koseri TaxID=545 RepID=A0A2X2V542_CITKO|nr:nucleoside-specific channel-forming protein [Citrobacter koseri]
MGLGTDIETGLPMSLSLNVYAKYQWQNYLADNENEWDGYRFQSEILRATHRAVGR